MNKGFNSDDLKAIAEARTTGDLAGKIVKILESREINRFDFDINRPWGVDTQIHKQLAANFVDRFFDKKDLPDDFNPEFSTPRLLAVAKGQQAVWLIHQDTAKRRSAILKVLSGQFLIEKSSPSLQFDNELSEEGQVIELSKSIKGKLTSLTGWSFLAEVSFV